MASNLRVDTILPSTGTNVAIGTASGSVTFLGDTDISTNGDVTIGGNLGIGGTLTYEDVTNIDSVGVVTARAGLNVSGGTGTFAGDVSIADKIIHTGDTNTAIRFPAADTITAETGGSERLRIDSSGRILIGTTTEGSTVTGDDFTLNRASGNCGITIRTNNSSTGSLVFSDGTSGTAEYAGFIQYQHSGDILVLGNATGERLHILGGGRVRVKSGDFEVLGGEGANAEFRLTADEGDDGADYWRFQSAASGNNLNIATYASGAWVDKVSIDTNGKIGIGVASPSSFDVDGDDVVISTSGHTGMTINSGSAGSTSRGSIYFAEGTAGDADKTRGAIQYQHGTDFLRFITNTVERVRIDSSGNVGIGIDTINYPSGGGLTIYNATAPRLRLCNSSTGTGTHDGAEISIDNTTKDLYIENREGEDIIFYSGSERMRITPLGDLNIGQNATDTRLGIKQRSSAVDFITCRNTSSTLKFYVHSSGNTYNTNGNYSQISDQSLKENIVDAKSQWNDIKNIRIRNFNFTAASGMNTNKQIGCVAQEVEIVSPRLVTEPRGDGIKTVANSVLYMKAVKALQEAMTRIETLESEVAALKSS